MTQVDAKTISEIRKWLAERDRFIGTYGTPSELIVEGWLRALLDEHDAHEAADARRSDVFGDGA
jgi:hypothetical protein